MNNDAPPISKIPNPNETNLDIFNSVIFVQFPPICGFNQSKVIVEASELTDEDSVLIAAANNDAIRSPRIPIGISFKIKCGNISSDFPANES